MGLLCLSAASAGGRRLYSDEDVVWLYQILSVKDFGFLLLEIKAHLAARNTPAKVAAALPPNLPRYVAVLALLTVVCVSIGSVLGQAVKNGAKLAMVSQLVFLPSILLSGILFPETCCRGPATYRAMPACRVGRDTAGAGRFLSRNLLPLLACGFLLRRGRAE